MAETAKAAGVEKPAATTAAKAPEVTAKAGVLRDNPAPGSRRRVRRGAKRRQGPFVKYVGPASDRRIAPSDWASLPDVGQAPKDKPYDTNVWNLANDKMIESAAFTDAQLDYLLIDDMQPAGGHSFLEVDYNEDGALDQVVYDDEDGDE